MLSPGSISNAVPDPDAAVRLQRTMQRDAQEQASARSLQQSQIGAGGLLVSDGGSITVQAPGTINLAGGAFSAASVTASATVQGATVQGATVVSTGDVDATSGSVNTVNVAASGQVYSTAAFKSPGSYAYHVVSGYQAMWINSDGTIGISASTRDSKKDLIPLTDLTPLMALKPQLGRYIWDDETEPLKQFLIAEDVVEAGFGPDVAPLDENGNPLSVNYSQLVPALIAKVQELSARLDAAKL